MTHDTHDNNKHCMTLANDETGKEGGYERDSTSTSNSSDTNNNSSSTSTTHTAKPSPTLAPAPAGARPPVFGAAGKTAGMLQWLGLFRHTVGLF